MRAKGNKEMAFNAYRAGLTHKENAKRQGVTENTVKSWCMRYGWKKRLLEENNLHLFMKRLHKKDA